MDQVGRIANLMEPDDESTKLQRIMLKSMYYMGDGHDVYILSLPH